MPLQSFDQFKHSHVFDMGNPLAERNTLRAVLLTFMMMVVEIVGGYTFNSMALLADGWHMSSHVLALGLSVLAYVFARRFSRDTRFTFGTWKIEVLASYSSALFLLAIAALMLYQSLVRLINPSVIQFDQAIWIAAIGLGVNLVCAWWLRGHHDHHHEQDHHGHHHDLNLRAAYLHVIADAATSVLAIIALVCGKFLGIMWLDPTMGIIGSMLVSVWAWGLLRDSGRILLDAQMNDPVVDEIREVIDMSPIKAQIVDLHVWRVGKGKYACIVSLVVGAMDATPEYFRQQLAIHDELVHVTVEVNRVGNDKRNN